MPAAIAADGSTGTTSLGKGSPVVGIDRDRATCRHATVVIRRCRIAFAEIALPLQLATEPVVG